MLRLSRLLELIPTLDHLVLLKVVFRNSHQGVVVGDVLAEVGLRIVVREKRIVDRLLNTVVEGIEHGVLALNNLLNLDCRRNVLNIRHVSLIKFIFLGGYLHLCKALRFLLPPQFSQCLKLVIFESICPHLLPLISFELLD